MDPFNGANKEVLPSTAEASWSGLLFLNQESALRFGLGVQTECQPPDEKKNASS